MNTSETTWLPPGSTRFFRGNLAESSEFRLFGRRQHGAGESGQKIIKTVIRCSQGSHPSLGRRKLTLLPLLWLTRESMAFEPAMQGFHLNLKNKYFVLRHGRSIPNEQGLIVASMEHGVLQEYGLASTGILQAEDAGKRFLKRLQEENIPLEKVRIYASPFSRTRQTAELVARVLDPQSRFLHVQFLDDLRERYFGPSLELQSHDLYSKVWLSDLESPLAGPEGGESVADVARRLSEVVLKLEALHQRCVILLVSHGDPLQILQAVVHAASKERQEPSTSLLESLDKPLVSSIRINSQNYAMTTGELKELF